MAKSKRKVVGSVYKAQTDEQGNIKTDKFGRPVQDYIKLRGDTRDELAKALLSAPADKGLVLRLESKKNQLESLEGAIGAGKLSKEIGDAARERINKIPDYVRFEIVLIQDNN